MKCTTEFRRGIKLTQKSSIEMVVNRGGSWLIVYCRPRLCNNDTIKKDIWKLLELILKMNEGYNFLRHYSLGVVDIVLYAI